MIQLGGKCADNVSKLLSIISAGSRDAPLAQSALRFAHSRKHQVVTRHTYCTKISSPGRTSFQTYPLTEVISCAPNQPCCTRRITKSPLFASWHKWRATGCFPLSSSRLPTKTSNPGINIITLPHEIQDQMQVFQILPCERPPFLSRWPSPLCSQGNVSNKSELSGPAELTEISCSLT